MSENEGQSQKEARQQETTSHPPVLRAEELFQGNREICIEHDGKRYRLRITRRNKRWRFSRDHSRVQSGEHRRTRGGAQH